MAHTIVTTADSRTNIKSMKNGMTKKNNNGYHACKKKDSNSSTRNEW